MKKSQESDLEKVKESVEQEIATYKDMIYELREELERLKAEKQEQVVASEEVVEEETVEEPVVEETPVEEEIEEVKDNSDVEAYKNILDELKEAIALMKTQEVVKVAEVEEEPAEEPVVEETPVEETEEVEEETVEEPVVEEPKVIETTVVETQFITKDLTRDQYLEQLETLQERLRVNEKEFKTCKKEYIPLHKINKNLARDEKKLRKKEAVVAKQKVVLYGVNNYAEIDPEKAKALAEDMNLLEELKASVYNCNEIMKKNASRYPVLERMYTVLKEQNEQLKKDIAEIEAKLAEMPEDDITSTEE